MQMKEKRLEEMPLMETNEGIVLFHPHIPASCKQYVTEILSTRWIGQGPKVNEFENLFTKKFVSKGTSLAVGSGTNALHLAYILAGLKEGDEVIVPVFTCTATNIPFLYMGVKPVFADIDPDTMNINTEYVKELITEKTKAIVCVHYGGLPCNMDELQAIADEHNLKIIEDAAHAVGAKYKGKYIGSISDFTMFSFQAIKHITTGDGGMLVVKDDCLREKGERVRWFGIDRHAKQKGIWENDIKEVGYKYQMTDIAAAMGIAAMEEIDETLALRKKLLKIYEESLQNIDGIKFIGGGYTDRTHAAWLCTILVDDRINFQKMLRYNKIESNQVHYRNDRYSIFGGRQDCFPNMDNVEEKYLVLPLHTKITIKDVNYICEIIKKGW